MALPSAVSYCFRIGVNVVFMAAFGIPITAFTIFLIASSHMLSGIFAITPGGVGQTQALDVATLRSLARPAAWRPSRSRRTQSWRSGTCFSG